MIGRIPHPGKQAALNDLAILANILAGCPDSDCPKAISALRGVVAALEPNPAIAATYSLYLGSIAAGPVATESIIGSAGRG